MILILQGCGVQPAAHTQAVRDNSFIVGMRSVADIEEAQGMREAHELVICEVQEGEYTAEYLANQCVPVFVTASNKRVLFTTKPEVSARAGQGEKIAVIAVPAVIGALAVFNGYRQKLKAASLSKGAEVAEDTKVKRKILPKIRKVLANPKLVASTFGAITLGTLAFSVLFDHYVAGYGKREMARHLDAVFTTDVSFVGAEEVRSVPVITEALAAEFGLVINRDAQRLLKKGS